MRNHPGFTLCALITGAGCTTLLDDEVEIAAGAAELTGTRTNRLECGHDDGMTCVTSTSLAHNLASLVTWDPCYGGKFSWTATANLEPDYDRICVGGTATAGSAGGCSGGGVELTGNSAWSGSATGSITVGLATDGSVTSAGLTSLEASCSESLFVGVYRP